MDFVEEIYLYFCVESKRTKKNYGPHLLICEIIFIPGLFKSIDAFTVLRLPGTGNITSREAHANFADESADNV
jgi:hypothetical protein